MIVAFHLPIRHIPSAMAGFLLRDADGFAIDWKLPARLQLGEKLPPLNREGDGERPGAESIPAQTQGLDEASG